MSKDDDPPEEAGDNVTFLDMHKPTGKSKRGKKGGGGGTGKGGGGGKAPEQPLRRIPVLPSSTVDLSRVEMQGDVLSLDAAAVNMRIDGAGFQDIARVLGLPSARDAKTRIISALAKTHPTEDWETVRQLETARAESLLKQSMAMAKADWLVDANDPNHLIPNEDKIRWHSQAREDLALHATITGAKAPVRFEYTPTDQEYSALVGQVLALEGATPPEEYDILDAEVVEDDDEGEAGV